MTTTVKNLLAFITIALLCVPLSARAQSNLPESHEATFIEANGSSEVLVKAKGIGGASGLFGFKEEESLKLAEMDARKSAVYFVLYGGAGFDGILKTEEEKEKFKPYENEFFASDNIMKFISWEANGLDSRVKMAGGEKLKVEKQFRINVKAIKDVLLQKGIIMSSQEVAENIGLPTLMALPEVKPGESPLEMLQKDPLLKQGAAAIESYLTAKQYNVIAPEQAQEIYQDQKAQMTLKGGGDDMSYAIALSVGSDVYITYSIDIQSRSVGSTEVHKASVSVRAYETTTARLLGTETGYSDESAAPQEALVEAAITNALNNVMSRINAYWADDMKNGVQYKVIFNVTGKFTADAQDELSPAALLSLKKLCNRVKENVVTDKTMEYLAWVTNPDFQNSSLFFLALKKEFAQNFTQGSLRKVSANRKLLMLAVE
ncbi:MAG TPA: DUF6175 family protein [Bacteroidota bacterium]|nr:DUF6175 family protein [Bacteroidota bacterium]